MADPNRLAAKVRGPLAPYALGFFEELRNQGCTMLTSMARLRWIAHLSLWMQQEGVEASALSLDLANQFCDARRRDGWRSWVKPREIVPLLEYLGAREAVPHAVRREPATAEEHLLAAYHDYLVKGRGLVQEVVSQWERVACLFTANYPDVCGEESALTARDVTDFVTREVPRRGKKLATALRTFLRFLHLDGRIQLPLAQAVPMVAAWNGASLPRWVEPGHVIRLLKSCDLTTALGRRDYSILLLLVRLGLRAGEVAVMQLDDIDWRAAEMVVRGKGNTEDRLPIPNEVGEALADYLRHGRPASQSRALFLRANAPIRGLTRHGIRGVVYDACDRVGVPRFGPHRLRHSAATAMLRAGASLPQVGQVLRHRSLNSTATYAKVDHVALRELALPWPGGSS